MRIESKNEYPEFFFKEKGKSFRIDRDNAEKLLEGRDISKIEFYIWNSIIGGKVEDGPHFKVELGIWGMDIKYFYDVIDRITECYELLGKNIKAYIAILRFFNNIDVKIGSCDFIEFKHELEKAQ